MTLTISATAKGRKINWGGVGSISNTIEQPICKQCWTICGNSHKKPRKRMRKLSPLMYDCSFTLAKQN
ncbi:hypothetical protein AADEFJLK_02884 [Methylovulum psychrotolerans]|uniref:Uncharacterized protein n=1 Tax=Methylovulum psychrotolerans TaxID=1704499 RepID=A0A2S5CKX8_9GAMM|nr:hypothetical protein AADEFJLK_02884 [Methylovulum psychrotolerans]